MCQQFSFRCFVAVGVAFLAVAGAQATVTMDYVTVGNPRNVADTVAFNAGSVSYTYQVGKYEVTAGQYAEFLNALAWESDPYGLYNDRMGAGCRILQDVVSDPNDPFSTIFQYTVAEQHANRPVNWVSFWNAVRFCNWMHNGQGDGDTETGSYTLTPEAIANNTVVRNPDATIVVPNNDEWHKAAYYDPARASYYIYATSSDTPPMNVLPDEGNNANTWDGATWRWPLALVGSYENSASPYGTFDQTGNVREWTDTAGTAPEHRILRDGQANWWNTAARSSIVTQVTPETAATSGDAGANWDGYGFRVVLLIESPPEDIPGDANNDRVVDAEDAKVLALNWGSTGASWTMGDFDRDGIVGPKDAAIMAANWGFGPTEVESTAVPEPSSLFLVLLGCLVTMAGARRPW